MVVLELDDFVVAAGLESKLDALLEDTNIIIRILIERYHGTVLTVLSAGQVDYVFVAVYQRYSEHFMLVIRNIFAEDRIVPNNLLVFRSNLARSLRRRLCWIDYAYI